MAGLAALSASGASAQGDRAKVLVGKWEGQVQFITARSDPNRTLMIDSVAARDGKVVASARYGITGKGLGRVEAEVDESGAKPLISFVTGAQSKVRLQLVDDRTLAGTLHLVGPGEGERPMNSSGRSDRPTAGPRLG